MFSYSIFRCESNFTLLRLLRFGIQAFFFVLSPDMLGSLFLLKSIWRGESLELSAAVSQS